MNETLFYVLGIGLAVLAVTTSFVGLRASRFPRTTGAMIAMIGIFAALVIGTTTFAVRHAQDEEAHKAAELHEAGEEAEGQEAEGQEAQ